MESYTVDPFWNRERSSFSSVSSLLFLSLQLERWKSGVEYFLRVIQLKVRQAVWIIRLSEWFRIKKGILAKSAGRTQLHVTLSGRSGNCKVMFSRYWTGRKLIELARVKRNLFQEIFNIYLFLHPWTFYKPK